jgi:cytochrome c peroxidase
LRRRSLALALLLAARGAAAEEHAAAPPAPPPPLLYELPAAGSYELPVIERVSDHVLLDDTAARKPLLDLRPGEVAVVSFVYLSCTDAWGCPLALATLQRADRALAARPDLRDHVRLVTVSFDPARDTPAQMAMLRHHMAPQSDWRFFTASSPGELGPVLADFGQDAVPRLTGGGRDAGTMGHVLKVFLVDDQRAVRNVYSTGFLDYRLLLRDIETLLGAKGVGASGRPD